MTDRCVDVTITDPPYTERTMRGAARKEIDMDSIEEDTSIIINELLRVTKRWVVVFCELEQLGLYREIAGKNWIRAGIWVKQNPAPQFSGDRPAQGAEGIAIMHPPGRKRWNGGGHAGVWYCRSERGLMRPKHPCPKPVALMSELIRLFSNPGELIYDPFMGSGSTGVAALQEGRCFQGVEIDGKYAADAEERILRQTWPNGNVFGT